MATNESNVSILKNFIFKIAEQAYTSNDTFNSVKAGIVEEHLNGKYKVKLDHSGSLVEATLFYSNEQINQNDYVYLIEAFTENNSNFIKYFIFGKVSDVNTEIGKSDWSRFIEAGESGTKSSEWTWGTICTTPLIYDSSEDHKSFIDSINDNGHFAIYGDFTCKNADENLREYGLNITLTYEDDKPFVYKFSSQDFIGQPFNIEHTITQKKIFKIAKNIASISIQGFEDDDNGSATISLSKLTIVAGSLYMLDPNIEVKISAAADSKDYFKKFYDESDANAQIPENMNDSVLLEANATQYGKSIFSSLMNYIWYINDPDIEDEDANDYWKMLNSTESVTLTDINGNTLTYEQVVGKAKNLYLYKGTNPINNLSDSEKENYLGEDFISNSSFGRKIKCEVSYEGKIVSSNIFNLWDYQKESYNVRIDSSMRPVTFFPGDGLNSAIALTAVKMGGPEQDGPKHNFIFQWTCRNTDKIYKIDYKEGSDTEYTKKDITAEFQKGEIKGRYLTLYLDPGEGKYTSDWNNKYVINSTIELTCGLYSEDMSCLGEATQQVSVAKEEATRVETHYQYYMPNTIEEKYIIDIERDKDSSNDANEYFYKVLRLNNTNLKANPNNPPTSVNINKIITYEKHTGTEQEYLSLERVWPSIMRSDGNLAICCSGYFPNENIEKMKIYCTIRQSEPISNSWNHITFEKAFRETWDTEGKNRLADPVWYGEWNIKDDHNEEAHWNIDVNLAKIDYDFNDKDTITESTTKFSYNYFYENGLTNEEALKYILNLPIGLQNALYVSSRRVWIETEVDENSNQKESVGRQEEWSYPQILKATKGDGSELVQEALDKLNVFNSLTAGGRDQGMFFEDVYILTRDTLPDSNKIYYEKIYNKDSGTFDYNTKKGSDLEDDANPRELFLCEKKENQVYINAEYIQTGALRVGDTEGHIFYADIDQQEVEIGGFTVDSYKLIKPAKKDTNDKQLPGTGMSSTGSSGDPAFYAGFFNNTPTAEGHYYTDPWSEPNGMDWKDHTKFYVTQAGDLFSNSGKLGGFTITTNTLCDVEEKFYLYSASQKERQGKSFFSMDGATVPYRIYTTDSYVIKKIKDLQTFPEDDEGKKGALKFSIPTLFPFVDPNGKYSVPSIIAESNSLEMVEFFKIEIDDNIITITPTKKVVDFDFYKITFQCEQQNFYLLQDGSFKATSLICNSIDAQQINISTLQINKEIIFNEKNFWDNSSLRASSIMTTQLQLGLKSALNEAISQSIGTGVSYTQTATFEINDPSTEPISGTNAVFTIKLTDLDGDDTSGLKEDVTFTIPAYYRHPLTGVLSYSQKSYSIKFNKGAEEGSKISVEIPLLEYVNPFLLGDLVLSSDWIPAEDLTKVSTWSENIEYESMTGIGCSNSLFAPRHYNNTFPSVGYNSTKSYLGAFNYPWHGIFLTDTNNNEYILTVTTEGKLNIKLIGRPSEII